ncbi:hypothetical protein G8A07_07185 [Roseateles sp. DAIF2]|uniref:O-antigen ligase family protein n=1 Tax=Roseateles sp. DAIF2 TaxID=2714952 RepID=UPI0018A2881B|nr:hypothetical protein [Roseateles sp. DAIF2]QPF72736.1 hypothetical protein G8A07_07185 [Roseateles sp. DAIF2]
MSRFLTFRLRNATLALLVLWLVVSAFYYAQQLFSPNFYLGYDEGTLHKVLKYFACLTLSIYFCLAARAYGLMIFCALMLLLASYFAMDRGGLEIATLSIMVAGTMAPFILIPSLWEDRLLLIGRVIVVCGAGVGIFSVIEITVLSSLFESAWAANGSIRSISTLFNPNNLGLYVGVALLLLPYMRLKPLWTALCGALLMFSLAASGSRTAWVALLIVLIYALSVSADARARLSGLLHRHLPQLLLTGILLAGVYAVYLALSTPPEVEIQVAHRGTDLYTASIRWDNFVTFLGLIDGSLLFPDVLGERADYIQDNFYLVTLNSFGVIGLLSFLVFFATHFSPWRNSNPDLFPWKLVFVFYMVSGLSGSQLNSFPNNQLFFISMGALWVYRPVFGAVSCGASSAAASSS